MRVGYFLREEKAMTGDRIGGIVMRFREDAGCTQSWEGGEGQRYLMGLEMGPREVPSAKVT